MAKNLELQPYTDQFHKRYTQSRVFERPAADKPSRSTLYVDRDSGRWFEDNHALTAGNPLLSFIWKEQNPQVSEAEYTTVLEKHQVPVEKSPEQYQTLFVAHVAKKVEITVGQTDEEVRILAKYAENKLAGETVVELRNHGDFAEVLGKEADVFPGDFDYFKWRGPIGIKPDGTWESTIRLGRESLYLSE